MDSISCPIRALAQTDPKRVALEQRSTLDQNDQEVSYFELDRMVDSAVALLSSNGIGPGDVVAVLADNSIEYALLFFATMRSGFILMPLNSRLNLSDYNEQLELAGCRLLISQKKYADKVTSLNCQHISIEQIGSSKNIQQSDAKLSIDLKAEALIMFSSGSRNKARGVVLSWSNLYYSALGIQERLQFDRYDSWLASLPFYHIGGISILFRAMLGGFNSIIFDSFDPEKILKAIKSHPASYLSVVPTMLDDLISFDRNGILKEAKGIIVGGDGLNQTVRSKLIEANLPVMTTYGMTETGSMVTLASIADFAKLPSGSGKVLPYRKISVTDSNEILIGGKTVAVRYLGSDIGLAENGFFTTGDLGRMDDDGNLIVTGRSDDMIISGGENIDLNRITNALLKLQSIQNAVAIGRDDRKWGQRPIAFIELSDKNITTGKILELLRADLPSIYTPDEIIIVDQLPRTGSGKYDIVALRKEFLR